jgi:hypothetical protein
VQQTAGHLGRVRLDRFLYGFGAPPRCRRNNQVPVLELGRIARHPQRLGFGVEKRVLDRPQPLRDDTARGRPGKAVELGIDPLVVEGGLSLDPFGEPLDDGTVPGEPRPSSNSLQPTMPSSVVRCRK